MLQRSPLRADPGAVLLAATEIAPAGYRPSRVRGVGCFRRNTPSFAAKAGRGRARSEFATRPWERAPQGSRRSRSPQRNVAACPGSALLRRTPFKQPTLKLSNAPLPLVRAKVDGALAGALPHRSRASWPRFGSESGFIPPVLHGTHRAWCCAIGPTAARIRHPPEPGQRRPLQVAQTRGPGRAPFCFCLSLARNPSCRSLTPCA